MRFRSEGCFEDPFFGATRQFASADIIIIAAPFGDFSFPSLLRVYLERMCVSQMTFHYNEKGETVGDCRASRMIYVTTRGGYTGVMPSGYPNLAVEYLKAVSYTHLDVYKRQPLQIACSFTPSA